MRRLLAFIGFGFFCFSTLFFVNLYQSSRIARRLDETLIPPNRPEVDDPCVSQIDVTYDLGRRVMSERESQAIMVEITNNSTFNCDIGVALYAPDFVISPLQSTLNVGVIGGRTNQIVWIVSAVRTGSFELSIAVENKAQIFGITVTNILGLTAVQAQIVSLFGTILGPMATMPWWIERRQKRKKKK